MTPSTLQVGFCGIELCSKPTMVSEPILDSLGQPLSYLFTHQA